MFNMALQVLTLVQEVTDLRQTVARLESNRTASLAHTAIAAPINTLSITDIVANSLSQHGYESDASPSTPHHCRGVAGGWSVHGGLEPLLLEVNSVVTNPVFLERDFAGASVPSTPSAPAPRLLQANASQQVGLLHRPFTPILAMCALKKPTEKFKHAMCAQLVGSIHTSMLRKFVCRSPCSNSHTAVMAAFQLLTVP